MSNIPQSTSSSFLMTPFVCPQKYLLAILFTVLNATPVRHTTSLYVSQLKIAWTTILSLASFFFNVSIFFNSLLSAVSNLNSAASLSFKFSEFMMYAFVKQYAAPFPFELLIMPLISALSIP